MYKTVEGKWYDIWAAGVAINEVCVKRSQIGIVGPISELAEIRSLDGGVHEYSDVNTKCLDIGPDGGKDVGLSVSLNRVVS